MARVLRRPKAAEDIVAVWDFIAEANPDAADHWIDQLDTQLHLLATQSLMGRTRDELAPRDPELSVRPVPPVLPADQ